MFLSYLGRHYWSHLVKFFTQIDLEKNIEMIYFCRKYVVGSNIYHFDLNEDRTQSVLSGELEDKIAETSETGVKDMVFGEGFAGISD